MPIVRSPKSPSVLDYSDFVLNFVKRLFFPLIEMLLWFCDLFYKHDLCNTKSVFSWKCHLVSFALSHTIPRGPYNSNHQQRRRRFHFLLRVPVSAPSRLSNIVFLVSSLASWCLYTCLYTLPSCCDLRKTFPKKTFDLTVRFSSNRVHLWPFSSTE